MRRCTLGITSGVICLSCKNMRNKKKEFVHWYTYVFFFCHIERKRVPLRCTFLIFRVSYHAACVFLPDSLETTHTHTRTDCGQKKLVYSYRDTLKYHTKVVATMVVPSKCSKIISFLFLLEVDFSFSLIASTRAQFCFDFYNFFS